MPWNDCALRLLARLAILRAEAGRNETFHALTYNADTLLEEAIAAQGHTVEMIAWDGRMEVREPIEPSTREDLWYRRPSAIHPPMSVGVVISIQGPF